MRGSPVVLTTALALALSAHDAGAIPFSATVGISVGALGTLLGGGLGSSTANAVTVPASFAAGTVAVPVTTDFTITAFTVKLLGNGAGSFAGNPLAGTMPLFGGLTVKAKLFQGSTLAVVPFHTAHDPGSAAGANGIGVGGSIFIDDAVWGYASVFNTDWTEGAKTLTNVVYPYTYHVPAPPAHASQQLMYTRTTVMYTGTDSRTPGGLGQVTLVSPTKVVVNNSASIFVVLGTLTLNFVPEPGTLLLLGSGVMALAVLGRRRMGRQGET